MKKPILCDILFSGFVAIALYVSLCEFQFKVPELAFLQNLYSDLANIAFTSAGFILTILTVLVTFKANSKKKVLIKDYDSALSLFFNTSLYPTTTVILKNSIKVLLGVALSSFLIKAFSQNFSEAILFASLVIPVLLITMALFRCVLLLGKILDLQNKD
ncbi:hypothetical protein FGM00_10915 [Aggregatimonas sangjinii]|uniref:Uncharacterized protein n=1 Tax=Aggregatimonas sangjinii TaxID=2583587 RepID=A0A5B7SUM4_9FLAO|nr:hypothetical protein [Aggregatimonas sangjinii]QCX00591.1 hypothetical protein FGM00_10915 [Aggregatimonas sangjinii]